MNALFLTQSTSLPLFFDLMQAVREPLQLDQIGFYVADQRTYQQFLATRPTFESEGYRILKEWDIIGRAANGSPDHDVLRSYEARLGDPTLRGALIADRRVSLGPLCTLRQDYRPRFSGKRQLRILQEGLLDFEQLFDQVRPDFVASFICITFGEYLAYLLARERGIPFLNLRPTRIKNYVTFGESIFEPSERIRSAYEDYLATGREDAWTDEAREYLETTRAGHAKYEGVIAPTRQPWAAHLAKSRILHQMAGLAREGAAYYLGSGRTDHHSPSLLTAVLHRRLLNPLRARRVNRYLGDGYLGTADLTGLGYAFFPLHTEPEVSLLVYSRPYLNQIEVARTIANALPIDLTLVIKEHPASVGKRPLGYYRKLLEIPNARLADPALDSKALIENSQLVTTIAGSIGLEALVRGKPVITLGQTPYGYLPQSMTRHVTELDRLAWEMRDLLATYRCDDRALVSYVAAVARNSVGVNLYSDLLGKVGIYTLDAVGPAGQRRQGAIVALRKYLIDSLAAQGVVMPTAFAAAT